MLEKENTPGCEPEAKEFGKVDCSFDSTGEETLQAEREAMRAKVAEWNQRVAAYRAKTDKPIPEKVFCEHPAFESLKWIMSGLFFGSGEEEISSHAAFILSHVAKDDAGNMLYAGKGEEGIYAWMDACARSSKLYARADDIAKCALMDQNVELGGYLHALLFAEGKIAETPFAIAVREASYG